MYIATDSDGRITAMTDRKEFAIGMREVTLPDDFDNTKISDYIVSSDGTVTYSKKPETNEEKMARKQAEQSQQLSTAITMFVLANASSLTGKQLISVSSFFPDWEVGHKYTKGEIINYNGKLYRCLQDHKSQTTWDPADAPSLWAEILPGQSGDIGEWVQPGSTNTYMKGDKVTHNGKTWISTANGNVWEPGVYGWTEVKDSETGTDEGTDTDTEADTPAEWKQPTGAHDAYKTDDKVSHNGKTWISTANGNVWEPGVYGWTEYSE